MTSFAITKIDVLNVPVNKYGNRLVARFNLELAGITLQGCALVERTCGTFVARGPVGRNNSTGGKGFHVSAKFTDPDLANAVTAKAVTAYAALTGRTIDNAEQTS